MIAVVIIAVLLLSGSKGGGSVVSTPGAQKDHSAPSPTHASDHTAEDAVRVGAAVARELVKLYESLKD